MEIPTLMKKIYTFLAAVLFSAAITNAQSLTPTVIASAGDYLSNGSLSLSFTLGEVAVTTLQSTNLILTQGFQQPFELDVGNAVEKKPINWSVKAYPNPVTDILNIRFTIKNTDDYTLQLMDITGKKLQVKKLNAVSSGEIYELDMTDLPPGIYLLNITSMDEKTHQIYKLRKK